MRTPPRRAVPVRPSRNIPARRISVYGREKKKIHPGDRRTGRTHQKVELGRRCCEVAAIIAGPNLRSLFAAPPLPGLESGRAPLCKRVSAAPGPAGIAAIGSRTLGKRLKDQGLCAFCRVAAARRAMVRFAVPAVFAEKQQRSDRSPSAEPQSCQGVAARSAGPRRKLSAAGTAMRTAKDQRRSANLSNKFSQIVIDLSLATIKHAILEML